MTLISLDQTLKHKNPGDEWYSYTAPGPFFFWSTKHKWSLKKWKEYGVALMAVYVRGSLDLGNVTRTKISSRAPLYTKNGVEIRQGYESTDNIKTCGYEIRVDSCIELNETLQALTIRTGIGIWKIKRIEIHNPACGAISIFRWHNPDGHGKQLHFWSATYEGTKRLYPDIPISEQEFYLGEFKESFAHCTCHEEKQRFHGCVLEKSARKPIK